MDIQQWNPGKLLEVSGFCVEDIGDIYTGDTAEEIAVRMGRTVYAVRLRIVKLGFKKRA